MISIIVPTWRRTDLLARCLDAIHQHTVGDYEVIIVDNGSEARGYTWAANRGLRATSGNTAVLLNDDVVVCDGWLGPLLDCLEEGYWVCSATDPEGDNWDLNPWCCAFSPVGRRKLGFFDDRYIHWLSDCEMRERIRRLGGQYKRVEESLAMHVRAAADTVPAELLTTMRDWHMHDYGTLPGW